LELGLDTKADFPIKDESLGYNLIEIDSEHLQLRTVLISMNYGAQIKTSEELRSKLCMDKTNKQKLFIKPPTLKSTSSSQCDYYILLVSFGYNGLLYFGDALVPFRVSADSTKRRVDDYLAACVNYEEKFLSMVF
jgi:hypothetical protein